MFIRNVKGERKGLMRFAGDADATTRKVIMMIVMITPTTTTVIMILTMPMMMAIFSAYTDEEMNYG